MPVLGHAAVVVDDFDAAIDAVAAAGHEVAETRAALGRAAGVHGRPGRPSGGADGRAAATIGVSERS